MRSSLTTRLENYLRTSSGTSRVLASYISQNLKTLPLETSASLASKLEVSESTVGRFCRKLGYQNFKDLKKDILQDLGGSPWLEGERLEQFRDKGLQKNSGLELEIAALIRVYEMTRTAEWADVVSRLATVKRVMVAGFQGERGLAISLAHLLQYVRDGVTVVDNAGNFGDVLLAPADEVALVVFDVKRYSRQSYLLCQLATKRNIPVTLITDDYCDWAAGNATEVLRVSTDFKLFWEATSTMMSLTQLLVNDVFKALGPGVEGRLGGIVELYEEFVGYARKT